MVLENQRREARVEARIKVFVVRGRKTLALETSDVSFKGLFLRTDDPPPLRSLLRLRIALPTLEIEVHAMTVYLATTADPIDGREPGVGVQFWGLAGPPREAWDAFVRDLIQARRAAARRATASSPPPPPVATPLASGVRVAEAQTNDAPPRVGEDKR